MAHAPADSSHDLLEDDTAVAGPGPTARDNTLPPPHADPRRILVVGEVTERLTGLLRLLRADRIEAGISSGRGSLPDPSAGFGPDLVIVDAGSHVDTSAVCKRLRALYPHPRPIIVFGASDTSDAAVARAFAHGADDYVRDEDRTGELMARVHAHLRILREREVLEWAFAQRAYLRDLAHTDALTQIPNRRRAAASLVQRLGAREAVAFALVDLDQFKRVNDTYGHSTGDLVLKRTARVLAATLSGDGLAARWGGEEFAAIVRPVDPDARQLGEALRQAVNDVDLSDIAPALRVTASVGIARWDGDGPTPDAADLVGAADVALYRSKREGRNRVTAASSLPNTKTTAPPPGVQPRSDVRIRAAAAPVMQADHNLTRPATRADARPRLTSPLSEMLHRPLSREAAYVLWCADQAATVEEIIDSSALPPIVAHQVLEDLIRDGLIAITEV